MSELEICRFAFEGKYDKLKEKIDDDKAYLTKKDGSGRIALHWAASGSQKNIVNFLLQQGSPVDESDDAQNWDSLMIATFCGCTELFHPFSIREGADVNAINQTGQTALHYAASKNRDEIVRILLANHANINAADNMGSTPLHRAASKGNIKIMKIFLEEYSNQLDLNPRDCVGNTPLHLACEEERLEAAKLLIEAGANTDTLNK
ncbi:26S proteasome non-ATPase regulatory subunit 10 like protein [Argiope bruennichi]|uniref:Alpha-latrotoxin n=1 Tax=Argiope bruennichi TaxID=94029 RepID=A0A8T0EIZ0_ARGBR|nr:26S proteasome non-ATPase regulatory subunit 10 like protein [Argiope bruennichi]